MVIWVIVKTTVELPDDLLIEAKKRAAETRSTVKEILESGLRRELAAPPRRKRGAARKIRWVVVEGRLARDLDLSGRERMHDFLRRHDRD
jgi:hypothetical protein